MLRRLAWLPLWGVAFLTHVSYARALVVAPPALPVKFMQAETVVVGRVIGLEDQDVEVQPYPNSPQKTTMRIAIVKIDEVLQGDKNAKSLKLGFAVPKVHPQGVIVSPGGRGQQFAVGQAGTFFLNKHHTGKFDVAASFYGFQSNQDPNYQRDLTQLRRLVQVRANPLEALKGKDADDKLLAVSMLLHQYRTNPGNPKQPKMAPVPAEENKLILKTLAEANWKAAPMRPGGELHPYSLFLQLNATKADGFEQPKGVRDIQQIYENAQRWLVANQEKFQIQRYVK